MKTGTTYYRDCLDLMTQWKEKQASLKADLIYLDPPLNSNANYGVIYKDHADSKETGPLTMFTDTWTWNTEAKKRVDTAFAKTRRIPLIIRYDACEPCLANP